MVVSQRELRRVLSRVRSRAMRARSMFNAISKRGLRRPSMDTIRADLRDLQDALGHSRAVAHELELIVGG